MSKPTTSAHPQPQPSPVWRRPVLRQLSGVSSSAAGSLSSKYEGVPAFINGKTYYGSVGDS
jgi:hypothetical protein